MRRRTPDVFVDANIAKNFCNPLDDDYKAFVEWLFMVGVLVTSNKILSEYNRSSGSATSATSIGAIIARLTRDGRLRKFSNAELKAFGIPKHVERRLQSNRLDHEHLKCVMLSEREFALTNDRKFINDLSGYPGHSATVARRPKGLPYNGP